VSDVLKLNLERNNNYHYSIADLSGRIMKTGYCINEIVVDKLEPGVYLIHIGKPDEVLNTKFIKN